MKSGTLDHPKLKMLARRLDVQRWGAAGLLESLWHFASKFAPAGNIGRFDDEAIAEAIDWKEEGTKLITALVESRWLDRDDQHRLLVHDWPDHADDAVHMRLGRKGAYFADGTRPSLKRFGKGARESLEAQYDEQPPSPPKLNGASEASPTHEDAGVRKKAPGAKKRSSGKSETPTGFARFWQAYPHHRWDARAKCLAKWNAQDLEAKADTIVAHVNAIKKTDQWQREGGTFAPLTTTYLNNERWETPLPPAADGNPTDGEEFQVLTAEELFESFHDPANPEAYTREMAQVAHEQLVVERERRNGKVK